MRTEVLSLQNIECGWTEFYGDPHRHALGGHGLHLQEMRQYVQEDKMTIYSNYLEKHCEATPTTRRQVLQDALLQRRCWGGPSLLLLGSSRVFTPGMQLRGRSY